MPNHRNRLPWIRTLAVCGLLAAAIIGLPSRVAMAQVPSDPAASVENGVVRFDPADPGVVAAEMMMRQKAMFDPPERTLPEWCYETPPFDPHAPSPCPPPYPAAAASSLDERVDQPVRWFSRLSYLSMWTDGYDVPALVTTSPPGTAQGDAGVLPSATVLFGNEDVDDGQRSGAAIKLGWWLIDGQFMAIEGDYWALGRESTRFNTASSFQNDPANAFILARPFFNLTDNEEDAAILAFPGFVRPGAVVDLDGSVDIETASNLQSAGMTFRHIVWGDFERDFRLDVFGGYRFIQLDESIAIRDSFFDPGGGLLAPTLRQSSDIYDTRNDFHGGEIGLSMEIFRRRWAFELMAKAVVGNNHQVVTVDGNTTIESLGSIAVQPGGLLAEPADIGRVRRDTILAIPEGSATIRYAIMENLELGLGFRVMYMDDVVRPGQQIDTVLDDTTPVDAPPVTTDLLLRGFDVSLEYRW